MLRACALWVMVMGMTLPADAYVRTTTRVGEPVRWSDQCIPFHLHQGGSDDVGFGKVLSAFRNALSTWMNVDCSALSLDYQGVTDVDAAGFRPDGPNLNILVFRERAAEWVHSPSAFAVTTVTYCENLQGDCEFLGQIRDTDIEINGAHFVFSAALAGAAPQVDLENTLTHELGHVLGLSHSVVEGATMIFDAAPGDTTKRSLHADDIEGVCDIYPAGAAPCGDYLIEGDYFAPDAGLEAPPGEGVADDGGCDAVAHRSAMTVWMMLLIFFALRRRYG